MKGFVLNLDHHSEKVIPHKAGESITQLSSLTFLPSADLESVPKSSVAVVYIHVKPPNARPGVEVEGTPIAIFSALKAQTVRLDLRFLMEEVSVSVRYRHGKPSGSIVLTGSNAGLA